MDTHELKCNPTSFKQVYAGLKAFEWRKKDKYSITRRCI